LATILFHFEHDRISGLIITALIGYERSTGSISEVLAWQSSKLSGLRNIPAEAFREVTPRKFSA
jgi:hypothetical protein